jgi:hypothetical protein
MGNGIPQASSGSWKKWRNTSGAKSGPVRTTKPLEELKALGEQLVILLVEEGWDVRFDEARYTEDTVLTLIGIWGYINVKAEARSAEDLLHGIAPCMCEEAVEKWSDRYYSMSVTKGEAA